MKTIRLTKGKVALVDDDNFEFLNKWKWYFSNWRGSSYAKRDVFDNGKRKTIHMHHLIIDGFEIDHINGDGLDNRKSNLRSVTHAQNLYNQKPQKGCSSIYKGVSWNKNNKNWNAYIKFNQKKMSLGTYIDEKQAALAYNKKAHELFGEFARLNVWPQQ